MVEQKLTKGKPKEVTVRDMGGVHELRLTLGLGVNRVLGPNGSGKTSTISAITKALGGDAKIERRDGASKGSVEIDGGAQDGGVTLSLKNVARTSGEVELELAPTGPLANLIDPQIDDEEKAAAARLRALLEMHPLPVDELVLHELAGHDTIEAEVGQELREGSTVDLLRASERCRVVGHRLAREAEAEANRVEGAAGAAQQRLQEAVERLGGEEAVVATTAAEAEAAGHEAARALAVARESWRQRSELLIRQGEAKAAVGEVPNPFRFDPDIEARSGAIAAHDRRLREIDEEIRQLEAKRSKERELMAGVAADLRALEAAQTEEGTRMERHRKLVAVLEQEVTGATAEEVEALELRVETVKGDYRAARLSDEVRAARAAVEEAQANAKAAKKKAAALRDAATSIGERLGEVLSKHGVEGLTVVDGRLAVKVGDEVHDFATRRSEGQRIAAALAVAAKAYPGKIVPLAGSYWAALDQQHRAEFARLAVEAQLFIITEEVAEGELRCEPAVELAEVAA